MPTTTFIAIVSLSVNSLTFPYLRLLESLLHLLLPQQETKMRGGLGLRHVLQQFYPTSNKRVRNQGLFPHPFCLFFISHGGKIEIQATTNYFGGPPEGSDELSDELRSPLTMLSRPLFSLILLYFLFLSLFFSLARRRQWLDSGSAIESHPLPFRTFLITQILHVRNMLNLQNISNMLKNVNL